MVDLLAVCEVKYPRRRAPIARRAAGHGRASRDRRVRRRLGDRAPAGEWRPFGATLSRCSARHRAGSRALGELRGADVEARYRDRRARGADVVTAPLDWAAEIRCYMPRPGVDLIDAGPAAGLVEDARDAADGRTSLAAGEQQAEVRVWSVLTVDVVEGQIKTVHIVRNPDKLGHL